MRARPTPRLPRGRSLRGALIVSCVVVATVMAMPVSAQQPVGQQLVLDLAGTWDVLRDEFDHGVTAGWSAPDAPAWGGALAVDVPGILESRPETVGYDGVAWYRTRVPALPDPENGDRLRLIFDDVNHRADVWLDGEHLGRHDGGALPFGFDVTGRLGDGSGLVVRCVDPGNRPVDDLVLAALPHGHEGRTHNYGGVVGGVRLEAVPLLELVGIETVDAGETVRLRLQLVDHGWPAGDEVSLSVSLAGTDHAGEPVMAEAEQRFVPDAPITWVELELPATADLARWSPEQPRRHELSVSWGAGAHRVEARRRIGLRRFEVVDGRFLLNGEPRRLRGVVYDPWYPGSLVHPPTPEFVGRELADIRDAGFDLIRVIGRTPPGFLEQTDALGLLVHAEPGLGAISLVREETAAALQASLSGFADAVRSHPSVVMVGLGDGEDLIALDTPALHGALHDLLPHHLALSHAGWDGEARYLSPGSETAERYRDVQLERPWPWSGDDFAAVAELGTDEPHTLIYVSSYGASGVPAFIDDLQGFGGALWTEDARVYVEELEGVVGGLSTSPLGRLVPDVSTLGWLGQAGQARAAQAMAASLEDNAALDGQCWWQWRDTGHGRSGGLVSVWGGAKPALTALREVQVEGASPKPRKALVTERPVHAIAQGATIGLTDEQSRIVSPWLTAPGPDRGLPHVCVVGARKDPWGPDGIGLTLTLLAWARDGGTLLLLDPPDAGQPFEQPLSPAEGLGHVAELPLATEVRPALGDTGDGQLLFAHGSPLLADLFSARLFDERLATIRPDVVHHVIGHDTHVELAAMDGTGRYIGAAVQSVPYGDGLIVLSTLRLGDDALQDPVAQRVLENLVRTSAIAAIRHGRPPTVGDVGLPEVWQADLTRALWRHQIYFGLADRLAWQPLGTRPERHPPSDLAEVVRRKNAGLDLLVAGRAEEGMALLMRIEEILGEKREVFVRRELELAPGTGGIRDRELAERVARTAALARRLMGLGETDAALAELDRLGETLAEAPSARRPELEPASLVTPADLP